MERIPKIGNNVFLCHIVLAKASKLFQETIFLAMLGLVLASCTSQFSIPMKGKRWARLEFSTLARPFVVTVSSPSPPLSSMHTIELDRPGMFSGECALAGYRATVALYTKAKSNEGGRIVLLNIDDGRKSLVDLRPELFGSRDLRIRPIYLFEHNGSTNIVVAVQATGWSRDGISSQVWNLEIRKERIIAKRRIPIAGGLRSGATTADYTLRLISSKEGDVFLMDFSREDSLISAWKYEGNATWRCYARFDVSSLKLRESTNQWDWDFCPVSGLELLVQNTDSRSLRLHRISTSGHTTNTELLTPLPAPFSLSSNRLQHTKEGHVCVLTTMMVKDVGVRSASEAYYVPEKGVLLSKDLVNCHDRDQRIGLFSGFWM